MSLMRHHKVRVRLRMSVGARAWGYVETEDDCVV